MNTEAWQKLGAVVPVYGGVSGENQNPSYLLFGSIAHSTYVMLTKIVENPTPLNV